MEKTITDKIHERLAAAQKRLDVVSAAARPSSPAGVRISAELELPLVRREIEVLTWVLAIDATPYPHGMTTGFDETLRRVKEEVARADR